VISPCKQEMFAWLRYSSSTPGDDNAIKLDIDLCDEQGRVCVEMRGLSSRLVRPEVNAIPAVSPRLGGLLATPVWQPNGVVTSTGASQSEHTKHHVILCGLANVNVQKLDALLSHSQCLSLETGKEEHVAQRYCEHALACFEQIKSLHSVPHGKVLVHVIVASHQELSLAAGLSALLKTATMESPQVTGQIVIVPTDVIAEELANWLHEEKTGGLEPLIKYEHGKRHVLLFQELATQSKRPEIALREEGVYVITGGLGALGMLFAKEILERTSRSKVVLTG